MSDSLEKIKSDVMQDILDDGNPRMWWPKVLARIEALLPTKAERAVIDAAMEVYTAWENGDVTTMDLDPFERELREACRALVAESEGK